MHFVVEIARGHVGTTKYNWCGHCGHRMKEDNQISDVLNSWKSSMKYQMILTLILIVCLLNNNNGGMLKYPLKSFSVVSEEGDWISEVRNPVKSKSICSFQYK